MVSLTISDALWKLGRDIQHLFTYKPVPNYSISLKDMESLYHECYGHKLNPRVYANLTVEKLLKNKSLRSVLNVRLARLTIYSMHALLVIKIKNFLFLSLNFYTIHVYILIIFMLSLSSS